MGFSSLQAKISFLRAPFFPRLHQTCSVSLVPPYSLACLLANECVINTRDKDHTQTKPPWRDGTRSMSSFGSAARPLSQSHLACLRLKNGCMFSIIATLDIPPKALILTAHRPQPDPTTAQRKQTPRDPNNPTETGSARRSSLLDTKHLSRGSNSGMIPLCRRSAVFQMAQYGGNMLTALTCTFRGYRAWTAKNCFCLIPHRR